MGLLSIPLTIIWWPGCRQYPAISSKESLKLMKMPHTACNTRDKKRLTEVERRLVELAQEGKLTPQEKASYDQITAMARAGGWRRAEKSAFRFAQDQVGLGHPRPNEDRDDVSSKGKILQSKGVE